MKEKLFDIETIFESEWVGMPEFKMNDLTSHRKIIVHFRNDEDVKRFSELINQKLTPKQKSCWFPKMENRITSDKMYRDEK